MGSRSGSSTTTSTPPVAPDESRPPVVKGPAIFSYTCAGLVTGVALVAVVVFYCNRHVRRRAHVVVAGAGGREDDDVRGVTGVAAKIPEFAYTGSASGGEGAAQCSVCLGAVRGGEMVRRLPACKHLYHVECIDMWLASHATCPLCRTEVKPPPGDGGGRPAPAADESSPTEALPPV